MSDLVGLVIDVDPVGFCVPDSPVLVSLALGMVRVGVTDRLRPRLIDPEGVLVGSLRSEGVGLLVADPVDWVDVVCEVEVPPNLSMSKPGDFVGLVFNGISIGVLVTFDDREGKVSGGVALGVLVFSGLDESEGLVADSEGLVGDPDGLVGDSDGLVGDPEGLVGDPDRLVGDPDGLVGDSDGPVGEPEGVLVGGGVIPPVDVGLVVEVSL